jgi:3-dehydroquinate synthase
MTVMLPENVIFSIDPAKDLQAFIDQKKYSRVVVLADEHTRQYCLPLINIDNIFPDVIEIKSGEEQKNLETCSLIWSQMTDLALDRHAALVVLGGGVLGDMGGFCAATYKRGIDFVLIPTTLLSQVDASIGGKLGIDFQTFKNHIGVFQQPALTLLYSPFTKTLPYEELRSGFAEIVKHCLLSDKKMWDEIREKSLTEQDWEKLLKHSVQFKAGITTEDPREKGIRKILNAGHTIGHAVESFLLGTGQRILHGEAIAIGLVSESYIAYERKLLKQSEFSEIREYILSIYGKVPLTTEQIEEAAAFAIQDKKNKGNKILCVLFNGIGRSQWDIEITKEEIKTALAYYNTLQM